MKTKITLVLALFMLNTIAVNAQIKSIKNAPLTTKPTKPKLIYNKADRVIMEIVDGAAEGTFKISMASLTLTKYVDTQSQYVGSTSYTIASSSNKFFNVSKFDELTAEGSFFVNGTRKAANVRISTTKLGGQKMTIRHTEGVNTDLIRIQNLKIIKKSTASYIITGDSEKDGNITNYVFNIFRHVIQ